MQHLIEEENSSVDPTYVEDFLLTYRTFLPSPSCLSNKLLAWFNNNELGKSNLKIKVSTDCLLVNFCYNYLMKSILLYFCQIK